MDEKLLERFVKYLYHEAYKQCCDYEEREHDDPLKEWACGCFTGYNDAARALECLMERGEDFFEGKEI